MNLKILTIFILILSTFSEQIRATDDNDFSVKKRKSSPEAEHENVKESDVKKRKLMNEAENVTTHTHSNTEVSNVKSDADEPIIKETTENEKVLVDSPAVNPKNDEDNDSITKSQNRDNNLPKDDNGIAPQDIALILDFSKQFKSAISDIEINCEIEIQNNLKTLYGKDDSYLYFLDYQTMKNLLFVLQGKSIDFYEIIIPNNEQWSQMSEKEYSEIYNIINVYLNTYIQDETNDEEYRTQKKVIGFPDIKIAKDALEHTFFAIHAPYSYEKPDVVLLRCMEIIYCSPVCLVNNFQVSELYV